MVVYYVGFPLLMIAAVIDSSVLAQFRYFNGQPSLVLMLVIAWSLLNELGDALPWAIIGGIFVDIISLAPVGTTSLGYTLGVVAIHYLFGQMTQRNIFIPPTSAFIATLIHQAVLLIVLTFIGHRIPLRGAFVSWTLPTLLFNCLGILIVFPIMRRIINFFRPPRVTL